MSGPHLGFEGAYERRVQLAVELLDAVLLTRVSDGLKVLVDGLRRKPIVNPSGYFVWLLEKGSVVKKITVDPGALPYEPVEVTSGIVSPLTIRLQPTAGYRFPDGLTGLRGTLIESSNGTETPVGGAKVQLEWLNDAGVPQPAQTETRSDGRSGDFVSFFRLSPTDEPKIDADGAIDVQLVVERGTTVKRSDTLTLPQGAVVEPSSDNKRKFDWNKPNL